MKIRLLQASYIQKLKLQSVKQKTKIVTISCLQNDKDPLCNYKLIKFHFPDITFRIHFRHLQIIETKELPISKMNYIILFSFDNPFDSLIYSTKFGL